MGISCSTHCCSIHGCKYGYDQEDFKDHEYAATGAWVHCPISEGTEQPVYPNNNGCERCEADAGQDEKVLELREELRRIENQVAGLQSELARTKNAYGDLIHKFNRVRQSFGVIEDVIRRAREIKPTPIHEFMKDGLKAERCPQCYCTREECQHRCGHRFHWEARQS